MFFLYLLCISCSLMILTSIYYCEQNDQIDECTKVINGHPEFGFSSWSKIFFTISIFEEVIYWVALLVILPVMIKILVMFKYAYCDLYEIVKCKMITFIIFYEIFLSYRAIAYGLLQFFKESIRGTGWYTFLRIMDYTSELILISSISFISLKND